MSRIKVIVLATALCLLVGLGAYAQTTATLSGTVTTDGTGLPGVSVTIASPNLQGTRTTVSGDNGAYYFGALPPGKYTVKFELEGMSTVSKTVDVGVSQSGKADASLKVAAMAEAITVTAAAPSVLETPQVAMNVSGDLVEELPMGRTVLDGALLAPGVTANTPNTGQVSISGSPGYDNLVMVNGVVITENVRSQALELYVQDSIQETTVLTGSVSAEYGRFTGGVVNSITKSGGNEFSGSFRDSQTNPHWTDLSEFRPQSEPVNKTNDVYEATLGGFMIRDRLWFFAAGRKADTTSGTQFTRIVPGDTTRTVFGAVPTNSNEKYEIKLTGQITSKHSLVGSYYDETSESTNNRFTATSYDLEQFSDRADPKDLTSVFYNGILNSNLLIEGRYSEMNYGIGWGNGGQFTDFIRGTIVRNRADSSARWNSATFCGVCDKETRSNDAWLAKGNYYLATAGMGSHNLVGGVESFSDHRFSNNHQSGSDFRFFVQGAQRVNGSEAIYPTVTPGTSTTTAYLVWTAIFTGANESDLKTDSLFVNDKWDLNDKWSFNVGFRYDKNDGVDGNGNVTSDDSAISPRLTAIYDLKGDGKYRFSASYNEYVSKVGDGPGTAAQSAGNPAYIYYAYQGPAINPAGTPSNQLVDTRSALAIVEAWFEANGGLPTNANPNLALLHPSRRGHSVPGYDSLISSTLASPKVVEYVLGFGTQIGNNAYVKIDGISRDWKDFYAYRVDQSTPVQTDPLGIDHDVSIVENTNDISREYRGIQLQSGWRPGRFNVGFNYTYSTLQGNDEQESVGSGTIGNSPGSIYYSEVLNYDRRQPEGDLTQDQPHRVRAWVGYDIPLRPMFGAVNVSLLHSFDSGLNYSAVGTIDLESYAGAPTPAKYVAAPTSGQYYFSDRGEYKLSDTNRTDLALNYSFPKLWNVELFAQAELLNVFYNQEVTAVSTTVNSSGTSANFKPFDPFTTPVDQLIECPQGTSGANCFKMGAHWQKGSAFGTPTNAASYQLPRSYRFSVGARF
ncbi:MAG: TonB-dependent receptor [Thermoanaerobaculia bacterium]